MNDILTDPKTSCNQCMDTISRQTETFTQLKRNLASTFTLKEALEDTLQLTLASVLDNKDFTETQTELGILAQIVQDKFQNEMSSILEQISFRLKDDTDYLNLEKIKGFVAAKRQKLAVDLGIIKKTIGVNSDHKDVLENDILLMPGDSLVSENGEYKATMMRSGELVITNSNQAIVSTVGNSIRDETDASHYMIMQGDGNLVIYNARTIMPTWCSGTYIADFVAGSQYYLRLENSGELVMYDGGNNKVWTSFGGYYEDEDYEHVQETDQYETDDIDDY